MINHDFPQGSPAWHQHRATHFNASDAPAMMGISPFKTRQQLLHELHTGIVPEADPATMRRFADGHRAEALARPLAEKIIGEELYPVTGSDGELSASFDGLTMGEDVAFEHKLWNESLAASIRQQGGNANDFLAPAYRIQMEQQCMVAKCGRVLFMISKWDGDILVEERHCWYSSNAELAQQIRAGWAQFAKDLAAYRAPEVVVTPVAQPILGLPALAVQIEGKVVASNLEAYEKAATTYIAAIKTDLQDDQDFADAAATVKFCEEAEGKLAAVKDQALGQTASIDALFRTIDNISEQLRQKRLQLDKLVTKRKAEIKEGILADARGAYNAHVADLNAELGTVKLVLPPPDFAGAMVGKKKIESLRDAVNTTLAQAKIAADAAAKAMRTKLSWLAEAAAGFEFLFPPADLQQLVQKPGDDFQIQVTARIENHKARLDKERKDREAEEQRKREAAEQARQQAEAAQQPVQQQPAVAPTPAPAVVDISARRATAAPASAPTLTLGEIAKRLGFSLTAAQLQALGINAAGKDRGAVLYHEGHFTTICSALTEHIGKVWRDYQEKAA